MECLRRSKEFVCFPEQTKVGIDDWMSSALNRILARVISLILV